MRQYIFLWTATLFGVVEVGQAQTQTATPLVATIDQHMVQIWASAQVKPTPAVDDTVWLRRVYLDLLGRIPTATEAQDFVYDKSPTKREQQVIKLQTHPEYYHHLAQVWRRIWLPQLDANNFAGLVPGFERWLAAQFAQQVPYDRLVRELLTHRPQGDSPASTMAGAAAFIAANEAQAPLLAASTARAFLGLNLDCAQCHDHPFARWQQTQFWQFAAFFAPAAKQNEAGVYGWRIVEPASGEPFWAQVLTATQPVTFATTRAPTGPATLADWVCRADNPYFARNAVNRMWAYFLGTGLVEPLDDLSDNNPPHHPELLQSLAQAFEKNEFHFDPLIQAIVLSKAYSRSIKSGLAQSTQSQPVEVFADWKIRSLTGSQLFRSRRLAAGLPSYPNAWESDRFSSEAQQFADRFQSTRASHAERSIPQALLLMNGAQTELLTDPERSPILLGLATAPFLDDRDKVEMLFWATVSRPMSQREWEALKTRFTPAETQNAAAFKQTLADIFWALLNSSEFNTIL